MREYSYEEAIEFFKNLPHFVPPANNGGGIKNFLSLDAENALLEKIGNPQMDLKYIHVAGTNGKGSTSAFIATILQEANYKVGCFTSPFLYAYNEMYKVNGEDISDEDFARIFNIVKPYYDELAADGIYPSEYEILTVMSFLYFKDMDCDIVVMEVSMGGRVDTTNVIPAPLVSVITPISYDHMSILGNTLAEIATEKAGIIKTGTVVVSAKQEPEVIEVLAQVCKEKKVELNFATEPVVVSRNLKGQEFMVSEFGSRLSTQLLGTYQVENAALAMRAIEQLKRRGFVIPDGALRGGLNKTKWFGRFSVIKSNPPVIVDGGHNRQGASVLADSLRTYFPEKKITFVLGILQDKEVEIMLDELLPLAKEVFTVEVPNPRTMSADELAERIILRGVKAQAFTGEDLSELENDADVICMAGSLYLLGSLTVD
ncbi:dihydrofolate synthase / folylpolyglutamate synthase [Pseudobutyrivibrio sp. 49]|uniref:bifunctional folylpolyglutamate synthase/dihydrofolate synthase n=1 Tax=unclassified Pseudobutyrivibrio TaxID=2638619 RepID=UPI0008838BD9|nr:MULTISPECIES: folylpolyglutamate synthase/dihydrofolate synthase family protein [unclassified Pseudobutyrivibrio]SDH79810.1 dihydrofolate synthase / folylpolyglutamate synthase [Pseudobutyrivibrio sp. 49]SFO02074.1 dihydrofolate synthase / folylpolyglutamate synthase [Pseudobutyrivibrio sp. UC1225]